MNNERGALIIVSGTTCAGKGTVIKELLKRNENMWLSISYVTRDKRENEKHGRDYYFISKEEFQDKIDNNEMLEHMEVHKGIFYGTPKMDIEEKLKNGVDVILEIDVRGALIIKEKVPEAICIFVLAPSIEEVKRRIIARGSDSAKQIFNRFKTAYQEITEVSKYNYVVINDILEKAVHKVEAILTAEKCSIERIEETFLNSQAEKLHELLRDDKEFENEDIEIE